MVNRFYYHLLWYYVRWYFDVYLLPHHDSGLHRCCRMVLKSLGPSVTLSFLWLARIGTVNLWASTRGKPNFCQSLHEIWTKFSSFPPWILAHFIMICPFKMDIFSGEVSEITLQLRHCRNPQLRQPRQRRATAELGEKLKKFCDTGASPSNLHTK